MRRQRQAGHIATPRVLEQAQRTAGPGRKAEHEDREHVEILCCDDQSFAYAGSRLSGDGGQQSQTPLMIAGLKTRRVVRLKTGCRKERGAVNRGRDLRALLV